MPNPHPEMNYLLAPGQCDLLNALSKEASDLPPASLKNAKNREGRPAMRG
jgi:hypothetical protein